MANRYLRSTAEARSRLWISAKTSSAIEGIRKPFTEEARRQQPDDLAAFIAYWKRRASVSAR